MREFEDSGHLKGTFGEVSSVSLETPGARGAERLSNSLEQDDEEGEGSLLAFTVGELLLKKRLMD